jgi:hypothetical protein
MTILIIRTSYRANQTGPVTGILSIWIKSTSQLATEVLLTIGVNHVGSWLTRPLGLPIILLLRFLPVTDMDLIVIGGV